MLNLARTFDPDLYSSGDIAWLIAARHRVACLERRAMRQAGWKCVRGAHIRMHQLAARKKTVRIEGLRASMGDEAFARMVEQQQDARRHRGLSGNESQFQASMRWWVSEEGSLYWHAPRLPPQSMVSCELMPPKKALGWASSQQQDLGRPLISGSEAEADVVIFVPPSKVARFAAAALDWNRSHGSVGHRCRSAASIEVAFDVAAGERVPRVHVAGVDHDRITLMDAAALENLHSGDVIDDAQRLLSANGRVVALTGREAVGVALPRPHDQFDTQLRGEFPPTSLLPVGWDITDAASRIKLSMSWPAAPFSGLTLLIEARDEEEETPDSDVQTRIENVLEPFFQTSAARFEAVSNTLLWAPRQTSRLLRTVWHYVARALRQTFRVAQNIAEYSWQCMRRVGEFAFDYVLMPVFNAARRVLTPCVRVVSDFGRWCGRMVQQLCSEVWARIQPYAASCRTAVETVASAVGDTLDSLGRCVSQSIADMCSGIWSGCQWVGGQISALNDVVSAWWASDPLPRRIMDLGLDMVDGLVTFVTDVGRNTCDAIVQWWVAQPLPRRALNSVGDWIQWLAEACWHGCVRLEEITHPMWLLLFGSESVLGRFCRNLTDQLAALLHKEQNQAPVRLTRVRRH